MLRHIGWLGLVLLIAGSASAQTCPLNGTLSPKLVCVIPQVYGPFGFANTSDPTQSILNTGLHHNAHFSDSFLANVAPINEAVGIQVSQLHIASPSSGITFVYDPSLKTFAPSTDESLGPILGDRAPTIGPHKLFLGFSYQYFNYTSLDGQSLSSVPIVLQHMAFPPPFPIPSITSCPNQAGLPSKYAEDPCFVRDYVQTTNNIGLRVNQYTIYATYGITRHLDFSVAIPIIDVRMSVTSQATIINNASTPPGAPGCPGQVWHCFNTAIPALASQCPTGPVPCTSAKFSTSNSAHGIGDVVLRGKYNFYNGERISFAGGVDVRLPSGDELDFLGSGATGVKPFGVVSYRARVSPHAEAGYEWNGNSTLAGTNIVAGASATPTETGKLPNRFIYLVGADFRATGRLTVAFDIYGQHLFDSPGLIVQPYTDLGNCHGDPNCGVATFTAGTTHPNVGITPSTGLNLTDASIGLKYRIYSRLVLTANVLIKLDEGGLRSNEVPLVGVSYNF
jgi:hypothetical protein